MAGRVAWLCARAQAVSFRAPLGAPAQCVLSCGETRASNMASLTTTRSFTMYLVATLVIAETPGNAYTMGRTKTTTLSLSSDLMVENTAFVATRNDPPKVINDKGQGTNKDAHSTKVYTLLPTRTPINSVEIDKKSPLVVAKAPLEKITNSSFHSTPLNSDTTYQEGTVTESYDSNTLTEKSAEITIMINEPATNNYPTTIITENGTTQKTCENCSETSLTTSNDRLDIVNLFSPTTMPSSETLCENCSETVTSLNDRLDIDNLFSTTIVISPASKIPCVNCSEIERTSTDFTTSIDNMATQKACANCSEVSETSTELNQNVSSVSSNIINTDPTTHKENIDHVTDLETMVKDASSSATKMPSWKTYTTIDRKRSTTVAEIEPSTSTDRNHELVKSESRITNVTILNSDNTSSISPQEAGDTVQSLSKQVDVVTDQSKDPEKLSTVSITVDATTDKELNPQWSVEAGFKELYGRTADTPQPTLDAINEYTVSNNETELGTGGTVETESVENKKFSEMEAQSQLVSDAIREELMQEQVIKDKSQIAAIVEITTEDALSVRPISSKNIYTVSPHYKGMKKIDVQPLKPYVRDPDDNSWRNESLSLLGIVFNAKNASKPFTQVLKNKTEAELNNFNEKEDKNEVTDLRERLEKIAEMRKSKKKKVNKFGDAVYSDYEEGSFDQTNPTTVATSVSHFNKVGKLAFLEETTTPSTAKPEVTTLPAIYMHKETTEASTKTPKNKNKYLEYYDTTDDYDVEYMTMPKLDLKKFTTGPAQESTTAHPYTLTTTVFSSQPINTYLPERKPTIQYFPPRPSPQKVIVNDYDNNFQKKVNYNIDDSTKELSHTLTTLPYTEPTTLFTSQQTTPDALKNHYITFASLANKASSTSNMQRPNDDESFNRASYVIKHFKDLVNEALRDNYDKNPDFILPYTEPPLKGLTITEAEAGRVKPNLDETYDYVVPDSKKIVLNQFLNTFNDNSERFKVDFPILYNSSVVHSHGDGSGKVVASSNALMKMLHEWPPHGSGSRPEPCDTNCDLKVELSPAYELHYYVPDEEEKQVAEQKQASIPYVFRL